MFVLFFSRCTIRFPCLHDDFEIENCSLLDQKLLGGQTKRTKLNITEARSGAKETIDKAKRNEFKNTMLHHRLLIQLLCSSMVHIHELYTTLSLCRLLAYLLDTPVEVIYERGLREEVCV